LESPGIEAEEGGGSRHEIHTPIGLKRS